MGDPLDTPGTAADNAHDRLARELGERLGGEVHGLEPMLGGASRETWAFELDGRPLVLRRDPPGAPRAAAMRREASLLRAAAAAGVPVPEVVGVDDDVIVMQRLHGEAIARRILRDDEFVDARATLVPQCAVALARLHTRIASGDVVGLPPDEG